MISAFNDIFVESRLRREKGEYTLCHSLQMKLHEGETWNVPAGKTVELYTADCPPDMVDIKIVFRSSRGDMLSWVKTMTLVEWRNSHTVKKTN